MNQMLKKASTTCAPFCVVPQSLMFLQAQLHVWADGEMTTNVKTRLTANAEGLTDTDRNYLLVRC